MKKTLPILIALIALATAAFVAFKKTLGAHVPAAMLLPGDTLLFVDMPNLPRTALRWPKTELAQIAAEPEVRNFLESMRTEDGQMKMVNEKIAQILRMAPREVFMAVTSIEGPTPKWIAGFAFLGRKKNAEALLAEPRAAWKSAWPAGKSDIEAYAGTEVETFTYGQSLTAEAFKGEWYFVSNDVALLRSTLDACMLPDGVAGALGTKDVFKKATAPLPPEGDTLVFAQFGSLKDRVVSLLAASGQPSDPKQIAELMRMQAVAWGTKLDGAQMRDTIHLLAPGGTAEPPMARSALAFTAADSFLYYGMALPAKIDMPDSAGLLGGYLPMLAPMQQALAAQGLKWADLSAAFGPELGVVADWPRQEAQPTALLALDVRDAKKARAFVDVFTGPATGSAAWERKETEDVKFFQSPPGEGLGLFAPALALTDRFLVLGLSHAAVESALVRLKSGQAVITKSPAYEAALKELLPPTSGFGYLDTKALFECSYGTLRPLIAMSLAFGGEGGKNLDAGKLPGAETISRHLTPSVYSQSTTADGTLVESVGTLTFNQVVMAAIGGGVAAALPAIESALSGGLKLDPSLLQLSAPAPAPATPAPNIALPVTPGAAVHP